MTATFAMTGRRAYLERTGRLLVMPAVALLIVFAIVPLISTLYFSLIDYRLLVPNDHQLVGVGNYARLVGDPGFAPALLNTLLLIGFVLAISIIGGLVLALLLERPTLGKGVLRLLIISPFFVMPPVAALLWKNLLMQPVAGLLGWLGSIFGWPPFDWFADAPLFAIALIVAWQWLPFVCLILLTSLQSVDREQREAAEIDGASSVTIFRHLTLPHLARPIAVIVMLETIFLLALFAEIFVTTGGGRESSNLAFLVYTQAMLQFDIGAASAAGIVAIVFANVLAFFLIRAVGRSMEA